MGGRQCGSINTHIHYLALESETRVSKGWDKDSGEKGIQVEDVNELEGVVRVRRQESLERVITASRRVSPQFPAVSHEVKLQRKNQFKVAWLNGPRVHWKRLGGRGCCSTLVPFTPIVEPLSPARTDQRTRHRRGTVFTNEGTASNVL